MNIYFAEAPFLEASRSELLARLQEVAPEHNATILDERRSGISLADAEPVLGKMDGMIANFEEPDNVLKEKVLAMHSMGKSVLVGMGIRLNPAEVLSDIAEPPYDEVERRPKRAYFVYGKDSLHAIKVQRNGLGKLQLQTWLRAQEYLYHAQAGFEPPR